MSSISSSTAPPSPSSTVASAEDPSLSSEVDVLRGSVIKYVKGKIDDLREKKVEFGKNADVAAHNIRAEFEIILSWMYKMEGEIESHLNQIRNVRMRDIDERIQLISTELLPSLVVTPDGCVSEADIRKRIDQVREESDKVYDPSFDSDAASSIAFYTTNTLPRKLLERPIREFYFICGSPVLPRNFRMRISARDELASDSEGEDDGESSVTVQVSTVPASSSSADPSDTPPHPPPFSKFMLTEMMVRIEDMHAPKFPLKCVSLVELYKSNKLKFKTASTIEFHIAFACPKSHAADLQVQVMVTGNPVGGSPVLITVNHDMSLSVRPDVRDFLRRCEAGGGGEETNGNGGGDEDRRGEEGVDDIVGRMRSAFRQTDEASKLAGSQMEDVAWRTVNPGNMTTNNRTGANNADMDESDLRSVGVDVSTRQQQQRHLSTVAEVSNENSCGSSKSAPGAVHAVAVNHHVYNTRSTAGVCPVVGSPRVTRHVPLDQPSPIAARPTGIAALPVNPNLVNTPIEISTMNVEAYRRNLPVPEFVADPGGIYEDAPEPDRSHAFEMGMTNVRSLQDNLSDNCDADGGMNDTKLANKSVTFAAHTTIYEKKNNYTCVGETSLIGANPNATLLDLMGSEDPKKCRTSNCSNCLDVTNPLPQQERERHLVRTGQTKLSDGDQGFAKTLMRQQQQHQPSGDTSQISVHTDLDSSTASSRVGASRIWEMSDESRHKVMERDRRRVEEYNARNVRDVQTADMTNWDDPEAEAGGGKTARAVDPNAVDLANSDFSVGLFKRFNFAGIPQSVTAPPGSDKAFVSDIEGNTVYFVVGFHPHPLPFAPGVKFLTPRYVLCIPDQKVAVMDEKALYIIRQSDGKLHTVMFKKETHRFRGLAYHEMQGRLLTTETKGDQIYIHCIDFECSKDIVDTIELFPGTRRPKESKVCFIACRDHKVFATDMIAGQVYVTSTRTRETEVKSLFVNGTNLLKQAVGVAFDATGNAIVVSMAHRQLQVFNPAGNFVRSISIPHVANPCGVAFNNNVAYVTDTKRRELLMYNLSKNNQE